MKRKLVIFSVALFLMLTGCASEGDERGTMNANEDNNTELELTANIEGTFVAPGDTIQLLINQKAIDVDEYTVKVSDSDIVMVNEDGSITVDDDALSGKSFKIDVGSDEFHEELGYTVLDSLEETIDENGVITNEGDIDALVNKKRTLPSDYVPEDLVTVKVPTQLANPEVNQLRKVAADALYQMFEGAKKEGFSLVARSGYRSYGTQQALYKGNVDSKGQNYADQYSAKPGNSEHQTGLSMDITSATVDFLLSDGFGDTPEGIWTKENAHKYGFIIRYPKGKEDVVGYAYEPWHIRYVGIDLATKVYESGLTMEEYFALE